MAKTSKGLRGFTNWAMIYHEGLPVAVCTVEPADEGCLNVDCGSLRFERHEPLVLQFTSYREPGLIGTRMKGTVEGFDESGMRVLLEPTRG